MKKTVSIILALIITIAMSIPAFAAEQQPISETTDEIILTRAEETQWRYRVYNGQPQKRLWSITNECWLTDWMPL